MSTFFDTANVGEYFDQAGIPAKIPFNPDAKPDETLAYRHYNAEEVGALKVLQLDAMCID